MPSQGFVQEPFIRTRQGTVPAVDLLFAIQYAVEMGHHFFVRVELTAIHCCVAFRDDLVFLFEVRERLAERSLD
jgi:hypothetical protein